MFALTNLELDTYNLFAQISRFTEEGLVNYLVGLPIIFGIMLLMYSIVKFVFAGSSKPDKDRAKHLIWVAIIIILIVVIGYSIFSWFNPASQSAGELPPV